MIASGSRVAMIAAASPIAAHESRGDGSTRMFDSGSATACRATAAACDTPVTTNVSAGAASGTSRSIVACSSVADVPVSACRNFGSPERDSGHSRVPLPPARITA